MKILAIETSTPNGSVTVLDNHTVLHTTIWQRQKHSEHLVPSIENCLKEANLKIADLELIAVDNGPGSFTGLRVAVNAAKTFSFTHNIPIMSFNSLFVMASKYFNQNTDAKWPVACMLNAFKNMLYFASYRLEKNQITTTIEPMAIKPQDLNFQEDHIVLGDGFAAYKDKFQLSPEIKLITADPVFNYPDAQSLGLLAYIMKDTQMKSSWKELVPVYFRASEAEEKLNSGLLKPVPSRGI